MMKNKEIAKIFDCMATLLEMKEENPFKIRAYRRASETLWDLAEDVLYLKNQGRLSELPGIGEALQEKIIEYCEQGKITAFDTLCKEIPASILELCDIASIGPKKAKMLYDKLGICNLATLRKCAQEGKLDGLPGIREKTVQKILKGIQVATEGQQRMNLGLATLTADAIVAALKKLPEVKQIAPAGSLRRMKETIRDIDILVDSSNPKKVMDAFVILPQVKQINAQGATKSSILTYENVQVDLRVVEPKSFGAALLYFTGSKNFNVRLRQIAMKQDKKVNEYGIFSVKGKKERCLASKTEKECFEALDLPYIPPELREDFGEEELLGKARVKVPKLIELKDIKGELHVHSKYSDGKNTIEEMANAARAKGYEYIGISDHSPKLRIAGGVTPENLLKKKAEIVQLNKKLKDIRILFGTEVEIDLEGNLDYDEKILSGFDVVIAAVHSGFNQNRDAMTKRLLKVCRNPYVNIIAHPTGINIGKRDAYEFDLKEVCRAAVENNVYLEINSFPQRLDLNSSNVYFSRSQGVKFSINTDSHAIPHMDYLKFGIAIARRGWLTKKDVLNTLPLNDLLKALKKK